MIVGLKPYPAMKDSGVPWLGEVPVHWEARQLGQFGMLLKGSGGTKEDEVPAGIPCVRYGDLYTSHEYFILKARSFVSSAKAKEYTPIKFGDVLFAASGETIEEIGKSAVNLIPSQACCGGDVILFRPNREVDARYLGYGTDCTPSALQKATMGRGITVMHIYGDQLKRLSMALPPLLEQAAIVRYLDHADRRIQRYIRAKQKLVTLLEEQKQALIHQAVTGQIDVRTGQPYPAYKPSGVEWLGEVPEHWEVVPLKRIAWFKSGAGFPVAEQGRQDSEIPFLKVSDMTRPGNEVWIEMTGSSVSSATATRLGAFVFPAGSIIFPKVGGALLTNKRRLLRRPSCVDNNVMGCVVSEADLNYAFILLQQLDLGRLAKPGPVPAIGEGEVRAIKVVLPPTQEQVELVTFVHRETANLDSVILTTKRETTLLREYRTRLIADVVTGKLDVRAAAARLPDEAEEPEPRDETNALTEGEEEPTDDLDTTPEEAAV